MEHQAFLDEVDYIRKIGLGESQKVYKACAVSFDGQGQPAAFSIYDTNRKPSVYWWNDMLELVAKRDDEENTKTAITEVVRVLNSIKKTAPVDYTLLRNAAVTAFKQTGVMKFDDFVTRTFQNYVPQEPSLVTKWNGVVDRLRALPSKGRFDGQFDLVSSAVPFKRQTIKLSTQISLNYDENIPNLSDKIWSTTTPDGRNVVVVDAPDASDKFAHKPW
ncbi:hypothetical protein D7I39_20260 [Allopusillimonas ginsengisoli]|nr:hypothetical protein D7I39_20260 [Allopusillimonas ginsengisoli]